jgi:GntR family transcriptional regulator, transcriptional repressor for pyruvate dehydrogenase complex
MERAYRRVFAELLDEIVAGRIGAGESLPKADDIALRHVCSPGAAREAIRALEERRLVEVHAGQGQTVLADDRWMMLDRDVAEATLLRTRDPQLLREAVEFLRVVETQAAMLAAARAKDGDVLLLEQTLDQMRESSRGGNGDDRFALAESEFHRALVLIAGNRFLASALEPLHPVIELARRRRAADRDPSVIVQHERIVAAVSARDATAAAAAADDYGRHLASWLRVKG